MFETLLAMDAGTIAAFTAAGIVLNLTPGADVAFAVGSGISGGWQVGVVAAMGVALGATMHVILASLGISGLLMALPHAYDAIRWLGAAYLLYLAIISWRAKVETAAGASRLLPALRRGFWTNALNPKVALFIMAFMPQFTDPAIGPVWQQMLILGAIFLTTGAIITGAYGALAGVFGATLRNRLGVMNKISAIIFAALSARLALS